MIKHGTYLLFPTQVLNVNRNIQILENNSNILGLDGCQGLKTGKIIGRHLTKFKYLRDYRSADKMKICFSHW